MPAHSFFIFLHGSGHMPQALHAFRARTCPYLTTLGTSSSSSLLPHNFYSWRVPENGSHHFLTWVKWLLEFFSVLVKMNDALLHWLLFSFCVGVGYPCFTACNNVGKQVMLVLSIAVQNRSSTSVSLLFMSDSKRFPYPTCTHFAISELFHYHCVNCGAPKKNFMRKSTNRQMSIKSPFLDHLLNDFIGPDTGPVTTLS